MEKFNDRLINDFSSIRDAIFKYFVYQTSFIKNTEYDANNIIKALEDEQVRKTVKGDLKIVRALPYDLIKSMMSLTSCPLACYKRYWKRRIFKIH